MQPSPSSSRAVFVMGVGRSGTSTVSRGLAALGVDLGQRFKAASRKNPTGFFEHAGLLALSKSVRRALHVRAESLRLITPDELQSPDLERLRRRAVAIIREDFGRSPVWGFKYGRTMRILPFWTPVLAELNTEPSFVIALRNPLSVARSRAQLDPRRGRQEVSDLEWLVGMVPFLRSTRPHRLVIVDYDLLMERPVEQLQRIARVLDLPAREDAQRQMQTFAEEFISAGLRHTRFDETDLEQNPRLNSLVRDGYRLLRKLATDEWSTADEAFWSAWSKLEAEVAQLAPTLQLLDWCEDERRRAITSLFGPLQGLSLISPRMWRGQRSWRERKLLRPLTRAYWSSTSKTSIALAPK
jgi:hypothetical protein